LQPTFHQARRDLAMACLETGDVDSAKNHLIEVLRLNPGDAWSWVVVGNIYAQDPQEWATAEKFFRRALAVAPDDPWALNGLATIAGQRGVRPTRPLACSKKPLRQSPSFPMHTTVWRLPSTAANRRSLPFVR
jgi:Tfp pilus assembly protein PilF